jgi:hypothetical protein
LALLLGGVALATVQGSAPANAPTQVFIPITAGSFPICDNAPAGLLGYVRSYHGDPVRLAVQGDLAYLVDWSGSLQVFDISNLCDPLPLGYATWTDNEFQDVTVVGDFAYVANDADGLARYDVSDPGAPVRQAARKDGDGYANSLYYDGRRYAFVGQHYSWDTTLAIYDLTTFPDGAPIFYSVGSDLGHLWEVNGQGDRVYVAASGYEDDIRFQILDVSALPAVPEVVATLDLPIAKYGNGYAIEVEGGHAYLTALDEPRHDGGLLVINMADETAPFVEGAIFIRDAGAMPWKRPGLDVAGDLVCMASASGLYGFDVSDPANPEKAFFYHYPESFGSTAGGDVVIRGDLAITAVRRPEPWGDEDHGGLAVYRLPSTLVPSAP